MVPKDVRKIKPGCRSHRVLEELKNGRATIEDLSIQLKISSKFVSTICTQLMRIEAIHRPDWEAQVRAIEGTRRAVAVYAYGPGVSMPQPLLKDIMVTRIAQQMGSQTTSFFGHGIGRVSSVFELGRIVENRKDLET